MEKGSAKINEEYTEEKNGPVLNGRNQVYDAFYLFRRKKLSSLQVTKQINQINFGHEDTSTKGCCFFIP